MTGSIDRGACIGCALCTSICPDVFAMDEENIAVVVRQPDAGLEACAAEAAESCPTNAIVMQG